ncbi:MAG: hypothetical protein WCW16_02175 [Candidatus Magasanikbacteria bacterium]
MAIISTFYSILIPIENLRRVLSKEQLQEILPKRTCYGGIWFDDYLYCEISMGPADNEAIVEFWKEKGLVPFETRDGKQYWNELCLIPSPDNQPTLPCDWVEIRYEDKHGYCYNLRGKPQGEIVRGPKPVKNFFDLN